MNDTKESPFIQILVTERTINALDKQGNVWRYIGTAKGWIMLNMTRVNTTQQHTERPDFDKWE